MLSKNVGGGGGHRANQGAAKIIAIHGVCDDCLKP